ncbi:MAG: sterol desaturase family protein [Bdellovibrionaceae bacterium]|nr:sterol desaturase family protein [Bdellovibrionales bacterium]MCB9085827.1 sterol desaturase family protein [Pseudobdellovibrionaceae bacterium]
MTKAGSTPTFDYFHPFNWQFWSAVFIALMISLVVLKLRRPASTWGEIFGYIFDKKVWLHPSSIVDYKLYLTLLPLTTFFLVHLFLAVTVTKGWTVQFLEGHFTTKSIEGGFGVDLTFSLLFWVATDFGGFLGHYLLHRVPGLWEFHKTHHTAKVLNVVTRARAHPVDMFLFKFFPAIFLGILYGSFQYLVVEVNMIRLFGMNAFLFIFFQFFHTLRHSHIRWNFPRPLSYILMSPLQHHVHHSYLKVNKDIQRPQVAGWVRYHCDTNIGVGLAIWDWMFKTLYIPKTDEHLEYGLGENLEKGYDSVWGCYWTPFVDIHNRFQKFRSKRSA